MKKFSNKVLLILLVCGSAQVLKGMKSDEVSGLSLPASQLEGSTPKVPVSQPEDSTPKISASSENPEQLGSEQEHAVKPKGVRENQSNEPVSQQPSSRSHGKNKSNGPVSQQSSSTLRDNENDATGWLKPTVKLFLGVTIIALLYKYSALLSNLWHRKIS